jgi:hypothetical protein
VSLHPSVPCALAEHDGRGWAPSAVRASAICRHRQPLFYAFFGSPGGLISDFSTASFSRPHRVSAFA